MTDTAKIRTRSTIQDVLEPERPSPQTAPEKFVRLPGLFRRWEIEEELVPGSDFHIEVAGEASDGTPLFAAYWSEVMTPEMAQAEDFVDLAEAEEFRPQTMDGECAS